MNEMVLEPAMFDIYTFRTNQNYYSTFKVLRVFKDSVYMNYNTRETNKKSDVKNIGAAKNYDESMYYVLSNEDVANLNSSGQIVDVKRK